MSRKQAFHYVARVKGEKPTRFFHEMGRGPISNSAAGAFSGWARADVVLWPTGSPGEYRAEWFDRFSDTFRESPLTVLEEASVGAGGAWSRPSLPPGTKRG
jgi:hypothetical protein